MNADNNEEENELGLNSIRRKYKGGRREKNINYGIVLKTTKREIVSQSEQEQPIIKEEKYKIIEESKKIKDKIESPIETSSKITKTRIVFQGEEQGKSRQQTAITKTEIKEEIENKNNSRFGSKKDERGANSAKKTNEVTTVKNIITNNSNNTNNINNNHFSRFGHHGRQIKEESTTKTVTTTTTTNQINKLQNSAKKETEKKIISSQSNERKNLDGKNEITTKTVTTTTNQRTVNENLGKSAQKNKITSVKTVTTNISNTNERQSSRGRSQNQSQGKIVEVKKEINSVQRQNSRDSRNSRKDIVKLVDTYQRQSSRDIRNSRKEITEQINTSQVQNNRTKSQGQTKNQKIEITNEIKTIQRTNSLGKSQGQKLEPRKELNTSQRNSRRESKNSKTQIVKEVTTSTSMNKRNAGNPASVTTNKTVIKVKQNYIFNQDPKNKKTAYTGLSISTTNKINVKEQDHNKRGNVRNSSSTKNENNDKPQIKNEKIIKNNIQVQKVLLTNTATNQKKISNQKSTPVFTSNVNNKTNLNNNKYNINTNTNTNIAIASKLALNEIKSKEKAKEKDQKPYSTMTNFYTNRNNLSRITINESGKTPKKQYVLHVRKLDRIQSNSKMRIVYTNNMEEKGPIKTDFNHKIVVIKNITNNGEKMKYSNNTFNSNIARKVINESGKIIKKQVEVSPRKNEIIKSAKKPFKLTYTNFLENKNSSSNLITNQITNKKIDEKTNLNNKINLLNRFNKQNKLNQINRNGNNSRDSRNSRNKNSSDNNGKETKLITVKMTQIKNGNNSRNNSRGNSVNKNKNVSKNENIVTNTKIITKTTSEMKFNQKEGDKVVKKVKTVRRIRKENI